MSGLDGQDINLDDVVRLEVEEDAELMKIIADWSSKGDLEPIVLPPTGGGKGGAAGVEEVKVNLSPPQVEPEPGSSKALLKKLQVDKAQKSESDSEPEPTEEDEPDDMLERALKQLELKELEDMWNDILDKSYDWLGSFLNDDKLVDIIETKDLAILEHLGDIKLEEMTEGPGPMGFKLHFHFSPNDYFNDPILTKTYETKGGDAGPELVKSSGCAIDWKEGKDVTSRLMRMREKQKETGTVKMVTKSVEVPSFFGFFNPPRRVEGKELDEEDQLRLEKDFEVGQLIREQILRKWVVLNETEDDEAAEEEEEDEDEEAAEDEEEEGEEAEGEVEASPSSANAEEEDDGDVE